MSARFVKLVVVDPYAQKGAVKAQWVNVDCIVSFCAHEDVATRTTMVIARAGTNEVVSVHGDVDSIVAEVRDAR